LVCETKALWSATSSFGKEGRDYLKKKKKKKEKKKKKKKRGEKKELTNLFYVDV